MPVFAPILSPDYHLPGLLLDMHADALGLRYLLPVHCLPTGKRIL